MARLYGSITDEKGTEVHKIGNKVLTAVLAFGHKKGKDFPGEYIWEGSMTVYLFEDGTYLIEEKGSIKRRGS